MITHERKKQRKQHRWKTRGVTALAVIATAGLMAGSVQAEVSDFATFSEERQLSDAELAQLRGRFVDKGKIMFFGVQMSSEWRTSAGEHLMAGSTLRGDLSGASPQVSFEPHLTVGQSTGLPGSALGSGTVVNDAGTGNARGVVQSIQAGGNFNAAANDLQIDILDAAGHAAPDAQSNGSNLQRQLASGTQIAVRNGAQGMRVALKVPGMGSATQAVVPGRGLRQSIQLTSDLQRVRNLTRLQLYMGDRGASAGVPGLRGAVKSAQGLRR